MKGPAPAQLKDLEHIPGEKGWPILGNTLPLVYDTVNFGKRMQAQYGDTYRNFILGRHSVMLLGAEANEYVLFDKEKNFSSQYGWETSLGLLFSRGLMLLDFEEHRLHRRAMSPAFKTAPMKHYLIALDKIITQRISKWHEEGEKLLFYPAIKQLTLDLAATCFLGEGLEAQYQDIKEAFIDMVAAAVSPVRKPLPFTQLRRGVKGRERITAILAAEVPRRRESQASDIFTQMCHATHENGELLSTQDIVDHMSFLMMAAHDTLTSSMSSLIQALALNPEWQDKLRAEAQALNLGNESFPYDSLDAMPLTEMAFKEAMRLYPPVPVIPRVSMRAFEWAGYKIPAGVVVAVSPMNSHFDERLWEEPETFNPLRFTPENTRARHRYAWIPFSGGAHMCLGLHFAYMQAKCFVARLLLKTKFELEAGSNLKWTILPIPKPVTGLPIIIKSI